MCVSRIRFLKVNYVVAAKSGRIYIRTEILGFLKVLPQKRHPLEIHKATEITELVRY